MIHDFFFSELSEEPNYDYRLYHDKVADVSLHDDLVSYVSDSLQWVSSYNPAIRMEAQMGLNFFGPTVIKSAGARSLHQISRAWSSLFKQSPQELRLTGSGWINGQGSESGQYVKLSLDRDHVVASFDLLASTCLRVAESDDNAFIMHHGI